MRVAKSIQSLQMCGTLFPVGDVRELIGLCEKASTPLPHSLAPATYQAGEDVLRLRVDCEHADVQAHGAVDRGLAPGPPRADALGLGHFTTHKWKITPME